jgi:hypothetical protein
VLEDFFRHFSWPDAPSFALFRERVGFNRPSFPSLNLPHGVEQAFRDVMKLNTFKPAVKLIEKPALAAEVPDPRSRERKDAPSCMDTPPPSVPGTALPNPARCSL